MKRHLTEDELIKYQFDLVDRSRRKEMDEHLSGCSRCREDMNKLKGKFAALELLREETDVSEQLISKAVSQSHKQSQPKIIPFAGAAWLSAAAVVIIAASFFMVQKPWKKQTQITEVAKETEDIKKLYSDKEPKSFLGRKRNVEETTETHAESSPVADEIADDEDVFAKVPFAPASAIELVTLPRRENVQLTIYNSADLTLVRERRNLTLKRGWNWLQFMWANTLIDPTSLSLEPLAEIDKIDIQQLVYPARLKDIGRWLIRSEVEEQVPFEITYFTSGLSWRAFYMGTLSEDEKSMQLKSYVRVSNSSGEDYEQAQTRLIVGKVNLLDEIAALAQRMYPYGGPIMFGDRWNVNGSVDYDLEVGMFYQKLADDKSGELLKSNKIGRKKDIIKEGLSEYFLYTIEGTETIPDKWGKRLESFAVEDIEVKSLYKYDEQRFGNQTVRYVAFVNDEEHNLGQTPLPDGTVKIFAQSDDGKGLSYVGGTNVKYIPVDEEVELNLGSARLVKVEPKLMNFETDNYTFDSKGNIDGWDVIRRWKIDVSNARELPVEVEITRGFNTPNWKLEMEEDKEVEYKKHDATRARFTLTVQPRSKKTFEYMVTTYHGKRTESKQE
jgi:hypothetical protein